MDKLIFDLRLENIPYQMHDEKISRINLTESSIQLCFDDLHFNSEHRKAILEFSGMEGEVPDSAYLEIYEKKGTKISKRKKLFYAEEFKSLFSNNDFSLIVFDLWVGYESFMITGEVLEGNTLGDKFFSLRIESKTIEYIWM